MLSETIEEGLNRYEIGPRIRELRQAKTIGLVELGEHTGLSPGMLSRIETGRLFPTLPTLLRIAMVFGVGLDHFFERDRKRPLREVVRKADRISLPDSKDNPNPAFRFESLDFPALSSRISTFHAEFAANAPTTPAHQHAGLERIYVISGALGLHFDDAEITLQAGDAIVFDARSPHAYQARGLEDCAGIVTTEVE